MMSLTIFTTFAFVLGTVSAAGRPLSTIWAGDAVCGSFYQFILASQGIPGNVGYQQILVPNPMTIEGQNCSKNITLDFWYLHVPMMQYDCNSTHVENDTITDDFCCNGTMMAKKNTIYLRYWNVGIYGKQSCTASDGSVGCQWIYIDVDELVMKIDNKYCFTSNNCTSLLNFKRTDFDVVAPMTIRRYARSKCFPAGSDECTNGLSESWMTDPDKVRNSMDRLLQNCIGKNPDDPWCECDSDCREDITPPVDAASAATCECDKNGFYNGRDIEHNVNNPDNFRRAALGYLTTMYESAHTPFCGKQRSDFMDEIMKAC